MNQFLLGSAVSGAVVLVRGESSMAEFPPVSYLISIAFTGCVADVNFFVE
jgi:hypothetical protein